MFEEMNRKSYPANTQMDRQTDGQVPIAGHTV